MSISEDICNTFNDEDKLKKKKKPTSHLGSYGSSTIIRDPEAVFLSIPPPFRYGFCVQD